MAAAKKAAIGTLAGLAVSIPLSMWAKKRQDPNILEIAQRGGAVASAHFGGTMGALGYQIADAAFDRFVVYEGSSISGTRMVGL